MKGKEKSSATQPVYILRKKVEQEKSEEVQKKEEEYKKKEEEHKKPVQRERQSEGAEGKIGASEAIRRFKPKDLRGRPFKPKGEIKIEKATITQTQTGQPLDTGRKERQEQVLKIRKETAELAESGESSEQKQTFEIKKEEKKEVETEIPAKKAQEERTEYEEVAEKEEDKKGEPENYGDIEFYFGREDISPFRSRKFFKLKRKKTFRDKDTKDEPVRVAQYPKKIKIPAEIRVADLSKLSGIRVADIISKFFQLGKDVTINQTVSAEEASIICADYGIEVEVEEFDETQFFDLSPDPEDKLKPRPPVVVVMGHVDHGKTTLLDAIRETNVAEREVGGITQSIGAYTVEVDGKVITFIDTPGHEAFTEMRARGAKVADIAVLVVAADEGIKPQTEEAIVHARSANVPIVVAVNKIDKPGANVALVKKQLSELGLIPDDWGGDTLFSQVSAKMRVGIGDLLEKILLQAELLNLRANPDRSAEGLVIESGIDKGLGVVATVIVQRGTLKRGDVFVAGLVAGKVRNIFSDKGRILKEVAPGYPARIVIGGVETPVAGDKLYVVKDEQVAQKIVEERRRKEIKRSTVSLEEIYKKIAQAGEDKVILPVVIKAVSKGALDAIEKEIEQIKHPQVEIRVIYKGIGVISPSDINLAAASGGIVIGFNVSVEKQAVNLAKMLGVQVRNYKIIYEIIDDIKQALAGKLKPKEKEIVVGRAKVLKIFKVSAGKALGCIVENGKIKLGLYAKVKRDGQIIGEGKISSLRKFKDAVEEIDQGDECGVIIDGIKDIQENDVIECYTVEKEVISI